LVDYLASWAPGVVTATDYTAFEVHMTPAVMDACEFVLYDRVMSKFPEELGFIKATLSGLNKLKTRQGVKAEMVGRRMSGDMCTSLGNTWTNYVVTTWVAMKSGASLKHCIFEGDDGLMVTDKPVDAGWWERAGFLCKAESHTCVEEAGFCGKIFSGDKQVIRDPRKFAQNFAWSDKAVNAKKSTRMGLLRSKAMSAIAEAPNCPIVRALADRAYKLTQGYKSVENPHDVSYNRFLETADFHPQATSPATRALFAKLFGISPDAQIELEQQIRDGNVDQLRTVLEPSRATVTAFLLSVNSLPP